MNQWQKFVAVLLKARGLGLQRKLASLREIACKRQCQDHIQYIIHIIHVFLEVPIFFHSPAFGEATTGDCIPFSPLPQALVRYQSSGRTSPGSWPFFELPLMRSSKMRSPMDPMDLQNLDVVCVCISEPFPFLAAHHHSLKMPAAPESPSAQAR